LQYRVPDALMDSMRDREAIATLHGPVIAHLPAPSAPSAQQVRRESTASARMAPSVNDAAAVEVAT
jgi:hypothetical protein